MPIDYTEFVTSEHRSAPHYMAMVAVTGEAFSDITDNTLEIRTAFDLDTAEGAQLDVIGLWVGCSRLVAVALDNWFSWDVSGKGWNQGVWKRPFDPDSGLVEMDDVTYRDVLRAVIKFDHWDGTLNQYQEVLQAAFTDNVIWAVDNYDMSLTINVTGPVLNPLMSSLLQTGKLSELRPAGVRIDSYVLP